MIGRSDEENAGQEAPSSGNRQSSNQIKRCQTACLGAIKYQQRAGNGVTGENHSRSCHKISEAPYDMFRHVQASREQDTALDPQTSQYGAQMKQSPHQKAPRFRAQTPHHV